MTRVPGWEAALVSVIQHHAGLPFTWGSSDCLDLSADSAAACLGDDLLKKFRRYTTERGAAKVLVEEGLANVGEVLASVFPEIPPSLAQRGDIGVILRDGSLSAGVFTSFGFASKAEQGVIYEPITAVARAFKVS